jgi:hypothetical protein
LADELIQTKNAQNVWVWANGKDVSLEPESTQTAATRLRMRNVAALIAAEPKAPEARAELREQAPLESAATAIQEMKLPEMVPLAPGAMQAEMRLTDLILGIEKRAGASLPAVVKVDQGAYVTPYDPTLIRQVLHLKAQKQVAEGVVVVAMVNSAAQAQEASRAFRSELRSRQLEIVMGNANAVVERLSRKFGRSRVQVKPGKLAQEDQQAYLTAALLANGRVVIVGTQETVTDAFQISVTMILEASFAAAQAFARSA